jgi:hypothetical protein
LNWSARRQHSASNGSKIRSAALEETKTALGEERTRVAEELARNQSEHASRTAQLDETEQDRLGVIESIERMKTALSGLNEERAEKNVRLRISGASSLKLSAMRRASATRSQAAGK